MKKVLFLFFFLISCSASTSSSTELETNSEEESVIVTNTTLSTNDTHDDHDHHDDHEEEAHDDHDEETPKPIDLLPFDYYLIVPDGVPDGVPDKLEVLNYNLGEETVIHFEVRDVEKEIHVHGYDIHFMVYPNQDNILKIELTIAGEFEIEDHASGYEFARLIVSP